MRIIRKRNNEEEEHQKALVKWFDLAYPAISALLWATPNGGKRNILEATRLKQAGVRAGVPDLFLAVPRGTAHGLFIEMKSHKGKLTEKQRLYQVLLAEQGYKVATCYSWLEGREAIEGYLKNG